LPLGEPPLVRFENVTRVFPGPGGGVRAMDGVNLEVNRGEIFGILGRSGAGKSTLIRSINALERPDSGRVWFDGVDLASLAPRALKAARKRMGMIFQHFNLVKTATVGENVALPLRLHGVGKAEVRARVTRFLDLVGLTDKAKSYPAQLSGGQKQRVAIARALALEPDLLLSDEATSALDPETKDSILDLLKQINRTMGITVVLITHELSVVQAICDRVAVLDAGTIAEVGPLFSVFTHPQSPLTRAILRGFWHDQIPAEVLRGVGPGRRFVFSYTGPATVKPAVADLVERFHLRPNILGGVVTQLGEAPFGRLVVQIEGPQVDEALEFLRREGVAIEEVTDGSAEIRL